MNMALILAQRTACKYHTAGVVLVDENKRIVSVGYNGPTAGDEHCLEVGCAKVDGDPITGKLKRCRGAHAEINSIINAQDARRLTGSTVYTALYPCYDCMKAFNNVGVKEIVYFEKYESFKDINELRKLCKIYGVKVNFSPFLARGLSYYNWIIFVVF